MADAQYVVDIATSLTGGQQTAATLDAISANLVSAGASSDTLHDAIAQLTNAFDAAKTASAGATASLAAGQSEYAKLERAALQAAKAEEKAALSGVVPPDVAQKAAAASAAVNSYVTTLKGLEAEADKAASEQASLGKALSNAKQLHIGAAAATEEHAVSTRVLSRGLSELGGPLGQLGRDVLTPIRGFQALSQELGSSNALMAVAAIGTAALVAAVVAAAAALAYGVVKIAEWAIGLADATRNADLHEQALDKLSPGYAAVSSGLEDLIHDTGASRASLEGLTKSLIDAHVSVANMPDALRAAALAESALGTGGASAFINRIKAGTLSVKAFAAQSQASFGGIVADQMLSLDGQTKTFHENISNLFGGLDIEPALKGLAKLVGLFDENTAAGSAIKFLFTSVFQPLIDNADKAATVVEGFVLGFLIGLTKLYIFIKPAIKAVSEFFGAHDPSLTDTLAAVTKAGEYLAPVIALMAAAFVAVGVAVGVSIGIFVALQVAVYAVIAAVIYAGVQVVGVFMHAWQSVIAFFSGLSLSSIGGDLIHGLVNGLVGAGPAVLHAIAGVVTGAISSAKALLGIHSPSTVFAEIGDNTVAGFAGGVDSASDDAQSALQKMVDPSSAKGAASKPTASAAAGAKGSSSGASVTGNTFIFNGVKDADDAESTLTEALTRLFEGDAAQLGGALAPGA